MAPKHIRTFQLRNSALAFLLIWTSTTFLCPSYKVLAESEDKKEIVDNKNNIFEQQSYLIGPGDVLTLNLFDAAEYSGEYKVLNDGSVGFPLIGSINLGYLTINQATTLIKELYGKQLLRPDLNLTVQDPRPVKVSVVGEVERPGIYSLTIDEMTDFSGVRSSGFPTVVDAISKAGGITQYANLRKVTIVRRLSGPEVVYKKASLDLLSLMLEGDQVENPYLLDGDIIKVSKAQKMSAEAIEVSKTMLAPSTINVHVIGAVENPGKIEMMANTPLTQAILIAGGPIAWKASTGNVDLIRINRNGSLTRNKYRLDLNSGLSSRQNPGLVNGDIVKVNQSAFGKTTNLVKVVAEPFSDIFQILAVYNMYKVVSDD